MPLQSTSFRKELEDFIDSIINNKSPQVTGEIGLEVNKIIEALFESVEKQKIIKID